MIVRRIYCNGKEVEKIYLNGVRIWPSTYGEEVSLEHLAGVLSVGFHTMVTDDTLVLTSSVDVVSSPEARIFFPSLVMMYADISSVTSSDAHVITLNIVVPLLKSDSKSAIDAHLLLPAVHKLLAEIDSASVHDMYLTQAAALQAAFEADSASTADARITSASAAKMSLDIDNATFGELHVSMFDFDDPWAVAFHVNDNSVAALDGHIKPASAVVGSLDALSVLVDVLRAADVASTTYISHNATSSFSSEQDIIVADTSYAEHACDQALFTDAHGAVGHAVYTHIPYENYVSKDACMALVAAAVYLREKHERIYTATRMAADVASRELLAHNGHTGTSGSMHMEAPHIEAIIDLDMHGDNGTYDDISASVKGSTCVTTILHFTSSIEAHMSVSNVAYAAASGESASNVYAALHFEGPEVDWYAPERNGSDLYIRQTYEDPIVAGSNLDISEVFFAPVLDGSNLHIISLASIGGDLND